MEQNPSSKTTVENGRWFSLPDDIFQNIVTRLDIPQHYIIFFSDTVFEIQIQTWKPGLWSIIDNLFIIFCSPFITNFSLYLHYNFYKEPCSSTILGSWVRLLRARNVQHLRLYSHAGKMIPQLLYPLTIFRIHSLVSLNIDSCITNDISLLSCNNPITLPNLKKLRLDFFHRYRSLEWILRFCPSLEYLWLKVIEFERPREGNNGPILIASKSLKQLFLRLEGPSIVEVTIDAPKLEDFRYNSFCFMSMQMFDSISHVRSLDLSMGHRLRLYHSPTEIVFPNLAHLTLNSSGKYEIFEAIFSMLQYCPNLDVLKLYIDFASVIWIPKKGSIARIIKHVKLIMLSTDSVYFDEHMSNLVTYLLRSAPVLEKLIIDGDGYGFRAGKSAKTQFHQTLFGCAKASSSCEIEFSRGYRLD